MQGTGLTTNKQGSFILPSPTTAFSVVRCGRCGSIDFVAVVSITHSTAVLVCVDCGNNVPVSAHLLREESVDGC